MTTKQIVLASRPNGMPTLANFRFGDYELPDLQAGKVHLKGLYYSVDPYMRGRMSNSKSYVPPFQLGRPIEGSVIARVIESKTDSLHILNITQFINMRYFIRNQHRKIDVKYIINN